ncbi:hypothetical protein FIBSPDRAFT_1038889 [Athelia psychrophila]|uniref:Uncharacterized protein n=1 Tax=Athelia psychrophila TaxID=1759441 RepID=A0A166SLX5_9AGAM|nr:hypothetical protein FIBSPDRAFT_1038889 [Fibularhizoctonia sp. CBS 109695]
MQFQLLAVAVLSTLALATPAPAELNKRGCIVITYPDNTCPAGYLACNGAGSETICCPGNMTIVLSPKALRVAVHQHPEDEVRAAIRAGREEYAVTADSWPIYCYANFSYDPENAEDGLWRSSLLVKAFKFIFTSPSSVLDDRDADDAPPPKKRRNTRPTTRKNVAAKIGLTTVTGRSIAYIAVQLRFALSSASSWSVHDSDFSYNDFYNGVVAYFENPLGPMAVAHVALLLKWWNCQIFGRDRGTVAVTAPRSDTSRQRVVEQQQTREDRGVADMAAAAAAAAATAAAAAAATATAAAAAAATEAAATEAAARAAAAAAAAS